MRTVTSEQVALPEQAQRAELPEHVQEALGGLAGAAKPALSGDYGQLSPRRGSTKTSGDTFFAGLRRLSIAIPERSRLGWHPWRN
jgi:hypothetical protein